MTTSTLRHLASRTLHSNQPGRTALAALIAACCSANGSARGPASAPASMPAPMSTMASVQDALPAADALVRAANERMGGAEWKSLKSFHTLATAKSAMGDATIEFRFVAPDARLLVQTMPGGRGTMELGVAAGMAWMGEPGKARAVDPRMAEELAGGGDLQTLVHSISERFEDFRTESRETIDNRIVWRLSMRPRGTPTPDARWTLLIDAATGLVHGFDIPAPPKDARANAPTPTGQSIRLSDWRPVDVGDSAPRSRLVAFRTAKVSAGGMETELQYSRVAIDTLGADAIRPPEKLEPVAPMPAAPSPSSGTPTDAATDEPTDKSAADPSAAPRNR